MSIDISKYVNSYEFDYTLPGNNEVILFKPITTGQLKKLLVYENESKESVVEDVLDKLITECVISEGFDIKKLYLEDRFALLLELRKKSKGEDYNFIYTCPKCNKQSPITLDLNDLVVKKRSLDVKLFSVSDSLSFDIGPITRGDQIEIVKEVEDKKIENKNLKNVELATYSYAKAMKTFHTPEGDTDDIPTSAKVNLLDNVFTEKQYKDFIKIIESNTFGVDFTFEFKCGEPECDFKDRFSIPLNNFFV